MDQTEYKLLPDRGRKTHLLGFSEFKDLTLRQIGKLLDIWELHRITEC